jgi:hypothetical protein
MKPVVLSAVAAIAAFGLFESPVRAQTSETCFHSTVGGAPISTPMCFVAEAHSGAIDIPDTAAQRQTRANDVVLPRLTHSDPIPLPFEPPASD